ncbi:MAG: hypothetical protein AAGU19_13350 [Prolixibacteraceae bacterium]
MAKNTRAYGKTVSHGAKSALTLLFMSAGLSLFSQQTPDFLQLYENRMYSERASKMVGGLTYEQISGSPYFPSEFVTGKVIQSDSTAYDEVWLRLNVYTNQMEFKNKEGQVLEILEPERYDRFLVGENTFRFITWNEANRTEKGYFQLLAEGPASLYKKLRINFKEGEKPAAYKDEVPPQFVVMAPDYYIAVEEAPAQRIRNQKHVLELLSGIKPDLPAFVKKEKLNLNKEEDLIKTIEYCSK